MIVFAIPLDKGIDFKCLFHTLSPTWFNINACYRKTVGHRCVFSPIGPHAISTTFQSYDLFLKIFITYYLFFFFNRGHQKRKPQVPAMILCG